MSVVNEPALQPSPPPAGSFLSGHAAVFLRLTAGGAAGGAGQEGGAGPA